MPATEAVAMILPWDVGLSLEVWRIAGAACLAARKTLQREEAQQLSDGLYYYRHRRTTSRFPTRTGGGVGCLPKDVCPQVMHEVLFRYIREERQRACNARVGKEDVEPPVGLNGVRDDIFDSCLVGGVKLSHVHLDVRERGIDLALMGL